MLIWLLDWTKSVVKNKPVVANYCLAKNIIILIRKSLLFSFLLSHNLLDRLVISVIRVFFFCSSLHVIINYIHEFPCSFFFETRINIVHILDLQKNKMFKNWKMMLDERLNIFRRIMAIICCLFGLSGNIFTIIFCIKSLCHRTINFQRKVFHLYLVEISILGKLFHK